MMRVSMGRNGKKGGHGKGVFMMGIVPGIRFVDQADFDDQVVLYTIIMFS